MVNPDEWYLYNFVIYLHSTFKHYKREALFVIIFLSSAITFLLIIYIFLNILFDFYFLNLDVTSQLPWDILRWNWLCLFVCVCVFLYISVIYKHIISRFVSTRVTDICFVWILLVGILEQF